MNKTCSHCQSNLPLSCFHKHPTALYGVKHVCKECAQKQGRKNYLERLERKGKTPFNFLGRLTQECLHKRGDVRDDGMVFWSKRKTKHGFREWWMPKEEFEVRCKAIKNRAKWRYHNDPEYRKKAVEKNSSEASRARKRSWNKRNRHVLSSWHAERRAMMRGIYSNLTKEEKKRVADWYLFRDALNRVHGKTMFHVDHKEAIARGGRHHPDNLQVTTATYNVKKFVNAKPKD